MQKSSSEEKFKNQNPNSKKQTLKSNSKSHNPTLTSHHSGITLIALVVTVVVLLILAGVTITLMFGDKNIFDLAKEAGNKTNEAIKSEQEQIDELNKWLTENGWSSENGGSGENPETPTIPEGLDVGSTVSYNPSGIYKWQAAYCSSTKTPGTETELNDDVVLNSGETDFNISTWKILSIDETNKKVTLVPSAPTTGTVYLGEAQGYNNGVKLLNDACSSLYGNDEKGITARSIKIEDIEYYMTEEAKTGTDGAYNYINNGTKYGNQVTNMYTTNKNYPIIYGKEQKAVINGITPTAATLDLSDSPSDFIERSEGTSTTSNIGVVTTAESIKPYSTYWFKDAEYMKTAFGNYIKKDNTKINYYSLIMPQGTSTVYWVASRCVDTNYDICGFYVRAVIPGSMYANRMCSSWENFDGYSLALFPIVTLSSELLEASTNGSFSVKL